MYSGNVASGGTAMREAAQVLALRVASSDTRGLSNVRK